MNRKMVLLAFMLQPFVPALATHVDAVTPADPSQVRELEEIVIAGDSNSLFAARQAVVAAEDRFYARYNAVNEDHSFDMVCERYAPTGTLIERRVCLPRLVGDAIEANTQEMLRKSSGPVSIVAPELLHASAIGEMKRRMLAMVKKDPELLRALLERARLQQHLDALRQRKFQDRWIVWD